MREFFQVLNEYPWTSILLALFSLVLFSELADIIGIIKRK